MTCAGGDALTGDGATLQLACTDGTVTSRYEPSRSDCSTLRTDPAVPQVGEDARFIFGVALVGGLRGLFDRRDLAAPRRRLAGSRHEHPG